MSFRVLAPVRRIDDVRPAFELSLKQASAISWSDPRNNAILTSSYAAGKPTSLSRPSPC